MNPTKGGKEKSFRESESSENDSSLFHKAISGATPLRHTPRIRPQAEIARQQVKALTDRNAPLAECMIGTLSQNQVSEWSKEPSYLRNGMRPDTIRKLRREHWKIQGTIDLHGSNREEAKLILGEFLDSCRKRKVRCVKIIHGKGLRSANEEPVLRNLVRAWLANVEEVLAYCETPEASGGSGATLALLAST